MTATYIKILQGNCLKTLSSLKDKSVNTCVTSPPYWGLRDYGTAEWQGGDPDCLHMRTTKISKDTATGHKGMFDQGSVVGDAIYKSKCPKCGATRKDEQLGLEETPEEFAENLVKLFREVRRVLRDDGTVWLNLGDSYCSSRPMGTSGNSDNVGNAYKKHIEKNFDFGRIGKTSMLKTNQHRGRGKVVNNLKQKDLIGIPFRVAFALQNDGWYLRQDIIWHKPNPMPESVTDRCTKAHEYIFLLSKSPKYYYDSEAIKEKVKQDWGTRDRSSGKYHNEGTGLQPHSGLEKSYETKNKRSVWSVSPIAYKEAHFATYPPELIKPCILAGCPEGGTVLDPFGGSGTTAQVANNLNRNAILCELNPEYVEIAKDRLHQSLGMFLNLTVEKP
tara:strand:- start:1492 stop:2655 length:1164 start_codon:yes stop_codon:yes gene_type:complete